MDIGKTGSIFIWGLEEYAAGNEMFLTLTFKDSVNYENLFASYEKLILNHSQFQLQWVFRKKDNTFRWVPFSSAKINHLLHMEKQFVEKQYTRQEVFKHFSLTNERLPLHYYPVDDTTVVVAANHIYSNGSGFLAWIEQLLFYYNTENLDQIIAPVDSCYGKHGKKQAWFTGAISVFWATIYYVFFLVKFIKNFEKTTIDLTHGKSPEKNRNGYNVKTWHLDKYQTLQIVNETRKIDVSVTEYVCSIIVETLFDYYPEKKRVLTAIPSDLRNEINGVSPYTPGNYTASLFLQVFNNRPVLKQVHDSFSWLKKQVPYGMAKMINLLFKNQVKLFLQVKKQSKIPVPKRAPFENFTLVFSSMGEVKSGEIEKTLERITGNTKTQTIFISMGTLGGKLSLEVSVSNDLFDSDEVFMILDEVYRKLLQV